MNRKQKRVVIAGLSLVLLVGLFAALLDAPWRHFNPLDWGLYMDDQVMNWLFGGIAILTVIGLLVFSEDK